MSKLTDVEIRALYAKVTDTPLNFDNLAKAKKFITVVFDDLEPAGFVDADGSIVSEAWECSQAAPPVPLFKRPEFE